MLISFEVADVPATFRRSWFSGRKDLRVKGDKVKLRADPLAFTHDGTTRGWKGEADGHVIRIEKIRPHLFPAFRPHTFTVFVDQAQIAELKGF